MLAAYCELEEDHDFPRADDDDPDEWDMLLSCLEDCVLLTGGVITQRRVTDPHL